MSAGNRSRATRDGFHDVRNFVQANLRGSSLETLARLSGDPKSKIILAFGLPRKQALLPFLIASVRSICLFVRHRLSRAWQSLLRCLRR